MAKHGYFVDEETLDRMENTLLALRCFQVLSVTAEDDIPLDEVKAMLNVIFSYGGNSFQQAEYGQWIKQEASHVPQPL